MNVLYFSQLLDTILKFINDGGKPDISIFIPYFLANVFHLLPMELPTQLSFPKTYHAPLFLLVFNAAVGPILSVQNVSLIKVSSAALICSLPKTAVIAHSLIVVLPNIMISGSTLYFCVDLQMFQPDVHSSKIKMTLFFVANPLLIQDSPPRAL